MLAATPAQEQAVRVLIVDDQPLVLHAIAAMLEGEDDIVFHGVSEVHQAVHHAREFRPTVILQDVIMPGRGGVELIREYREAVDLSDVPIVVISGIEAPEKKRECFEAGANDYVVKLPDKVELLARIRYHSAAYRKGVERDDAFHLLMVSEKLLAVANFELQKLSGQDSLTGAANRREFDKCMEAEWSRASRSGKPLSLLMCDVDHFKTFNDNYGHVVGDLCLQRVAAAIRGSMHRSSDVVARYGGEEFAVILPETSLEGSIVIAERCRRDLECLTIPEVGTSITISVGAAVAFPTGRQSWGDLVTQADQALYRAKARGRNRVEY